MNTRGTRIAALTVLCGIAQIVQTGCVSYGTYELTKRDAESARLLYQNEHNRSQELAESNKKMKLQIEELTANLRSAREQVDRTDREFREARDELLKLKIDREQQRHGVKARLKETQSLLEKEKAALETMTDVRLKSQGESEDTKRRVKGLMQQLQALLEQLEQF